MSVITVEQTDLDIEGFLDRSGATQQLELLAVRSDWSRVHVGRTALMAAAYGRAVGMPENMIFGLRVGALLHDIAKILPVYQPILNSEKSPMTARERAIMGNHPADGARLIRAMKTAENPGDHGILEFAARAAKGHHSAAAELRADNVGPKAAYLRGVISVLQLADQMEALTSALRPYNLAQGREPLTPTEAAPVIFGQLEAAGHTRIFGARMDDAVLRMATLFDAEELMAA